MTNYPYEVLKWQDFEELTILLCQEILGIASKTFSDGRDGGRDCYFTGTAQLFPSTSDSWQGNFILQCKHTTEQNASCSDYSFEKTELKKEINRLIDRKAKGEIIDNYVIFTNRKLTGDRHPLLLKKIKDATGIKNVEIIGREQLNQYFTKYPHLPERIGLTKFLEPIRFYPDDIKDVIIVFSKDKSLIISKIEVEQQERPVINIDKDLKNKINNLNQEAYDYIKKTSLVYFRTIEHFLQNPINEQYAEMYENTVSDIQAKIVLDRSRFGDFNEIIEYIYDFVLQRHQDKLIKHRRFLRVFVHFMYYNCDIGKTA